MTGSYSSTLTKNAKMTNKLTKGRKMWNWVVGSSPDFCLESRLFHIICATSIFGIGISVFIDAMLDMPKIAVLMAFSCLLLCIIYYYSRFQRRYKASVLSFIIL